ncbi:hypothetical protein BsWGS_16314 [Bradybaena similaris]
MRPITTKVTVHAISRECSLTTSKRQLAFLLFAAAITCLVTVAIGAESLGQIEHRLNRNAYQLCGLVTKVTGSFCWKYVDYGCYCGLHTTSTADPVDDTDACCRVHDNCYGSLFNWCHWLNSPVWFVVYSWECPENRCACTDSPKDNPCDYHTCLCDLILAQCLQNTTYNDEFFHYKKETCYKT